MGDVEIPAGSVENALRAIGEGITDVLEKGGRPLCLGGEHTVTLAAVRALRVFYADFVVLHLDAHADLRESYEGTAVNHATVMHHVAQEVGPERLVQLGIRSGTREEFAWMKIQGTLMRWGTG